MTLSPTDRRLYARRPLRAAVAFDAAGQTYRGSCHDLGKGGLSFLTEIDLPIGEMLTLSIVLTVGDAQARLTVKGVICWKHPAEGDASARYGVAFSELSPGQLKVLGEFLTGMGEPPVSKGDRSA